MNPETLFRESLPLIERITARVCRTRCLQGADAEDFASEVKLRLIDDDYAVLRKFGGGSSLSTYLYTVVGNLLRDFQNARWGKWRPSAAAKRSSSTAMMLDTLLWRDGLPLTEAVEILKRNHHVRESREELEALAAELPPHPSRRPPEGEAALERMTAPGRAEDRVEDRRHAHILVRLEEALPEVLGQLGAEDRLLIRMVYLDGLSVATVARSLGLKQRSLYTQRDRILRGLRESLEARGLAWADVQAVLGLPQTDLSLAPSPSPSSSGAEKMWHKSISGPSTGSEERPMPQDEMSDS